MTKKLLTILLIGLWFILLTGCPVQPQTVVETGEARELTGYWKSSYGDGFEIKDKTYYQYDNADKTISFAGKVVYHTDFIDSKGLIIIQITDAGTWSKTVGQYYAVRWTSFDQEDKAKQSSAWKAGGSSTVTTEEEAKNEYTEGNGYFGIYADYKRQS